MSAIMADFFLDLKHRPAVMEFIASTVEFLNPEDPIRKDADRVIHDIEEKESVSETDLADLARKVARATWGARQALNHYVSTPDGADEEFRRVASAVSLSTGHLLERYRHAHHRRTLTDILKDEESRVAFGDDERMEIQGVATHILPVLWHEKKDGFKTMIMEADEELRQIEERIRELRDIAFSSTELEGEIKSKIERLEDRLYFEGEKLDTERLDEEVQLYREEKALPASYDREIGRKD